MENHQDRIINQFTSQAGPFSSAPAIKRREDLDLLISITQASKADTVLDVACSPGIVVCAFAAVVGRAVGIDITPAMIEQARRLQAEKKLSNVEWRIGDIASLPFEDASFSVVVSRFAFHHLNNPLQVLREMKRVCKKGGQVLLADTVASPVAQQAAAFDQMERLRDPSHVRLLSLVQMKALFEQAGLPVLKSSFYEMKTELKKLLEVSFPNPGDANRVRTIVTNAIGKDTLGATVQRKGEKIIFSYPIAVLVAENTPG